ncbi:MAG: preprotein translocase subunit YajC [Candidatus Binatia bacterium]
MIGTAWAQAGAGGAPPTLISFLPLALVFVVFYFLLIRPQQQKAKEHRVLLANLKKNDEVITSGGLYGRVLAMADDVITLEIAPNVKVRVSRPQIATVVSAEPKVTNDKEKDKAK